MCCCTCLLYTSLNGKEYHEGDTISLDGSTGNIYDGIIPTVDASIAGEFGRIMSVSYTHLDVYKRQELYPPYDGGSYLRTLNSF